MSTSDTRVAATQSGYGHAVGSIVCSEEDKEALRKLAEAVERAVRGGEEGVLGLDWGD